VGAGVDDFRSLKLADLRHHAFVSNPVANRASRAQGRSLMAACAAAFPDERLRVWADDDALLLHHAPALGAACAVLNVTRRDAQSLYLQTSLRGALSAAVRLGITGPLEAQRLQAASAPTLDAVLARCGALVLEEAAHTAPLHELFQGTQDRLYSRLFQS
jgi:urease accessory protein